jgi:hypothetical protein
MVTNRPTAKPVKLASYFVTKKRGRGPKAVSFVTLRVADSPMREAVYSAHNGDLPNDWIYAQCLAACEAIDAGDIPLADAEGTADAVHAYADRSVDIYTQDLYQWAAGMCQSATFANAETEVEECGGLPLATEDRFKMLQYCAIKAIVWNMLAFARGDI